MPKRRTFQFQTADSNEPRTSFCQAEQREGAKAEQSLAATASNESNKENEMRADNDDDMQQLVALINHFEKASLAREEEELETAPVAEIIGIVELPSIEPVCKLRLSSSSLSSSDDGRMSEELEDDRKVFFNNQAYENLEKSDNEDLQYERVVLKPKCGEVKEECVYSEYDNDLLIKAKNQNGIIKVVNKLSVKSPEHIYANVDHAEERGSNRPDHARVSTGFDVSNMLNQKVNDESKEKTFDCELLELNHQINQLLSSGEETAQCQSSTEIEQVANEISGSNESMLVIDELDAQAKSKETSQLERRASNCPITHLDSKTPGKAKFMGKSASNDQIQTKSEQKEK